MSFFLRDKTFRLSDSLLLLTSVDRGVSIFICGNLTIQHFFCGLSDLPGFSYHLTSAAKQMAYSLIGLQWLRLAIFNPVLVLVLCFLTRDDVSTSSVGG